MKRKFLIFICLFLAILSIASVSASEDVTDEVLSVSNDIAIDEIVSEVDSGDESIAVQNDDDSASLLAEGELKDPGLNLTVVRNGVMVSFNEENVNGIVIYSGDSQFNSGDFINYDGTSYLINLNGLPADDYPVYVSYLGNNLFKSVTDAVMVSVERNNPGINATLDGTQLTVSFDDENATMLEFVVEVWLDESEVKTFSHFYWDEPVVVDDFSFLAPGQYTVEVASLPDDYYSGSDIVEFVVTVPEKELKDPGLTLTPVRNGVLVSFNENVTGFFRDYGDIKVNEFINITGEPYLIDLNGFPYDTYPINVEYVGNDVYYGVSDYVWVTVFANDPGINATLNGTELTVSFDDKNVTMLEFVVEVWLDESEVKTFSHFYWNEPLVVDDFSFLAPGQYTVEVASLADDYYSGSEILEFVVTVPGTELKDPGLTLTPVHNGVMVSFEDENVTGFFTYYGDVHDGLYYNYTGEPYFIDLNGIPADFYLVNVEYVGNDEFANASDSVIVMVESNVPEFDVSVNGTEITIILDENDTTNDVFVDVPGENYSRAYATGWGPIVVDLSDLAPGTYPVDVYFFSDGYYIGLATTVNVTVGEENKTIISKDLTKIEKAPDRFEANFTDAEGNPLPNATVSFEIAGNTYNRTTDANGTAGMDINLEAGNYTVTITNPTTGETKKNTITVLSRFEDTNDLVKYFRNESQYVITVLGDDGKIAPNGTVVTFNINGVFYNRTVNESGQVKLNINLEPGTYIITAEYKGCRVSNDITVLPVLTGNDITKKYGVPGAYEATLVDGQGNPYANQTITLNINGVLYNRITDSNGVAKLNINLMPGEYIITANYGEARISNKVTVMA